MLWNVRAKSAAIEASELTASYLERFEQSGAHAADLAQRLCEFATSSDPVVATAGTDAIFHAIVEPWGDRFEQRLCHVYVQFFAQVIDFCRHLPVGREIDRMLRSFALTDQDGFVQRAENVKGRGGFSADELSRVKKVLILSRVTLGADVAVTSVLLNTLKRVCPGAELCLVGGVKAAAFFASDPRVRHAAFDYRRSTTLIDRLEVWPSLVRFVEEELSGLRPEQYLVVDPDSRLTQLGLLPLIHDESRYSFFPSRSYQQPEASALGDLAARWAAEEWGSAELRSYPEVSLSEQDRERGAALRGRVRGRLAAVNLGVGSNAAKRVADPFEYELCRTLRNADYTVILDRGAGDEEMDRTARLVNALEQAGNTVRPLGDQNGTADVLTWRGSLGAFAGLIAVSDRYVGYDSAGGHLAAALGVPAIDVFAGAVSPRMIERWRPWGPRPADVVVASPDVAPAAVLAQVRERLG